MPVSPSCLFQKKTHGRFVSFWLAHDPDPPVVCACAFRPVHDYKQNKGSTNKSGNNKGTAKRLIPQVQVDATMATAMVQRTVKETIQHPPR